MAERNGSRPRGGYLGRSERNRVQTERPQGRRRLATSDFAGPSDAHTGRSAARACAHPSNWERARGGAIDSPPWRPSAATLPRRTLPDLVCVRCSKPITRGTASQLGRAPGSHAVPGGATQLESMEQRDQAGLERERARAARRGPRRSWTPCGAPRPRVRSAGSAWAPAVACSSRATARARGVLACHSRSTTRPEPLLGLAPGLLRREAVEQAGAARAPQIVLTAAAVRSA